MYIITKSHWRQDVGLWTTAIDDRGRLSVCHVTSLCKNSRTDRGPINVVLDEGLDPAQRQAHCTKRIAYRIAIVFVLETLVDPWHIVLDKFPDSAM